MKLRLITLVFVLFAAAIALPVSAEYGIPVAMVTNVSVNPPIMSPESLGTITILVQQTGRTSVSEHQNLSFGNSITYSWLETVDIEQVNLEGNGFVVLSPVFDHIGEIGPDTAIPFTFTVRAPAKSGIYYLEARISTDGGSIRYPILVNVNTPVNIRRQAILIMNTTLPAIVSPGQKIPVQVTLTNAGGTLAEDVTLEIANVSNEIAPETGTRYYLGVLEPGSRKSLDIVLISDRNADPGLVMVPVTLQYTRIDGSLQSETASIDLLMQGEAELGFVSVDTSPRRVTEKQPFDITIRIENTGSGDARQVSVAVDLPMSGTKQSFVGKIKPGNDAPAVFMLDGGAAGGYEYNASISYVDDLGTHTEVRQMSLRVTRDDPAGLILVIVLVIIAGVLLAYRYWYLPRKDGNGALPWVKKS